MNWSINCYLFWQIPLTNRINTKSLCVGFCFRHDDRWSIDYHLFLAKNLMNIDGTGRPRESDWLLGDGRASNKWTMMKQIAPYHHCEFLILFCYDFVYFRNWFRRYTPSTIVPRLLYKKGTDQIRLLWSLSFPLKLFFIFSLPKIIYHWCMLTFCLYSVDHQQRTEMHDNQVKTRARVCVSEGQEQC